MEDSLKNAIQEMKNGEEKGFNKVYSATYNRVYFRAKQLMKKEEDAQDITQIVFIEAYKNIHTLQAAEALYSWLDGITYNQSMKMYRKKRDVLLTEEAEGIFDTLENNDISSIPELTADQKATADIIKGIIAELPELQRTAVVAYYFDGFKVEQIAEMMECSINTIKSRLNYARKYIKERVEEKEKKEGYRLHAFGLPVLWLSIKMLAEKTTLTVQAAQNVYNGACSSVGLQATTISVAGGAGTVGASTAGTVAGEAVKAAGIGAKFASLTTATKALIIAGTITVAGLATAGVVSLVNDAKTEMVIEEVTEENITVNMDVENLTLEDDLSEYLGLYFGEYWREEAEVVYPYKVSNTEYRFSPEDLKQYGDILDCVLVREKVEKLPDGVKLVVRHRDGMEDSRPEVLNQIVYMDNFDGDAWCLTVSAEAGVFINLADTSEESIYDVWKLEDDYSEFIRLYEVEVSEPYVYEYKYDAPKLTATKISDTEYRFKAEELKELYADGRMVGVCYNVPQPIELVSIIGGDVYVPGTTIDFLESDRTDANRWYFPLSTQTDIIVKVKISDKNNETEQVEETPKTIADIAKFTEYERWELADGSEGSTLYIKQIGSESIHIFDDFYQTIVEYEGYWTLDGQELHFIGKDLEILELTDLEGNPIDKRIAFYYLEDTGMIFVDIPNDEDYKSYAFRDTPDYVYKRMSSPISDKDKLDKTNSTSTGSEGQGVHLTNSGTTWQLTDTISMHFENGVFTVSGTGDMPDYNAKGEVAPWMYDVFRGDPTTVIIEEGITSITPMAFSGYLNITEVSLPSSLRKIGDNAFSSCNSLEEIVIPDGVEEIGDKVFFNSYSLKKIEIPASVTEIGDGIFMSGNSNLVIYGEKGSAAERYAQKWEISFVEK